MLRVLAPLLWFAATASAADPPSASAAGAAPGDRVDVLVTELDGEGFLASRTVLSGVELGALVDPGAVMLVLDAHQTEVVCELPVGAVLRVARADEPPKPARRDRQISLYDVVWSPAER